MRPSKLITIVVALAICTAARAYDIPFPYSRIANVVSADPLLVPVDSNDVELITTGARFFESLLDDIAGAKVSINMECYKFLDDETGRMVRDAIVAKAHEGVKVRVVIENVTHFTQPLKFYEDMRAEGVHILYATDMYRPLEPIIKELNNREHRKTTIIDDRIVSTGGFNLTEKYLADWTDIHLRITGPVAASYARLFYNYWHYLGGELPPMHIDVPAPAGDVTVQPVTGGPGLSYIPDGIIKALDNAKDYIWFQTGYFSPPDNILEALGRAAARGVDVRLLISERVDIHFADFLNEYWLKKALERGVKVYLYQPCFNHSKTIVCDDEFCAVGSANIVIRSMYVNFENYTFIYGRDYALKMKQMHIEREKDCRELTLEEANGWNWWRRFRQRFANIIHPLM